MGKEGLAMKKELRKKARVQDGTLVAFSCDCTSACSTVTCYNCTIDKADNTVHLQNYSKGMSTAIQGRWAYA